MRPISPSVATRRIAEAGGRIVDVVEQAQHAGIVWTTYWVTKDEVRQVARDADERQKRVEPRIRP